MGQSLNALVLLTLLASPIEEFLVQSLLLWRWEGPCRIVAARNAWWGHCQP